MSDEMHETPVDGTPAIKEAAEEPISIVESDNAADSGASKIHAFGGGGQAIGAKGLDESKYTGKLNITGAGAKRTRTFHCKLNDAALEFMDDQINDWIDANEVEIKFCNSTIGVFPGKNPEDHLILQVWY